MVGLGRLHTFLLLFLTKFWGLPIVEALLNNHANIGVSSALGPTAFDTQILVNRQAAPCPPASTSIPTRPTPPPPPAKPSPPSLTYYPTTWTDTTWADTTWTVTHVATASSSSTITAFLSGSSNVALNRANTTLSGATGSGHSQVTGTSQMSSQLPLSQNPSGDSTNTSTSSSVDPTLGANSNSDGQTKMFIYIGIALGITLFILLLLGFVLLLRHRRRANAAHVQLASQSESSAENDVTPFNIPPPLAAGAPAHNRDLEKLMVSRGGYATASAEGHGSMGESSGATTAAVAAATVGTATPSLGHASDLHGAENLNVIDQRIRVVRDEMMHLQAKLPSEEPLARHAVVLAAEDANAGEANAELTMERMQQMIVRLQDQVARLQRQQQASWAARLSTEPPPNYERDPDATTEGESKTDGH